MKFQKKFKNLENPVFLEKVTFRGFRGIPEKATFDYRKPHNPAPPIYSPSTRKLQFSTCINLIFYNHTLRFMIFIYAKKGWVFFPPGGLGNRPFRTPQKATFGGYPTAQKVTFSEETGFSIKLNFLRNF